MFKKLSRYYYTLKHLKPIQIRYQVWYRLRNRYFPVQYPDGVKAPKFQKLKLVPFLDQYTHYLGNNHFQFLNLNQSFKDQINWNYIGHGKLWAYHLNYFDYLHQSDMDRETGRELIESFLHEPQSRPEGMEPYPISLRTINWIKFLIKHDQYPEAMVDSIYAQYIVLTQKIEFHLLGNHLLENGFSLLFGAIFFQDQRLIQLSREILKVELKEQVLNDGAHFELSPMYHVILLQRALDGYNLLCNNEHTLQDIQIQLKVVIQKMVNWLNTLMFSNGDIPMFNDSTGGQALAASKILDYANHLGFNSKNVQLKESGYRKFNTSNFEMVIDVGHVGSNYQPGHAHSDLLSFVLYHREKPIIVDPGISTYEKNKTREKERGTASHNTVMLGNTEQTDVWGGFRVGRRALPVILHDQESSIKASHTGYDKLNSAHIREWKWDDNLIGIMDDLNGKEKAGIAYIHFHPAVEIEELSASSYKINNLILKIEKSESSSLENYSYCVGFNNVLQAKRLLVSFTESLKISITE